MIDTHLKEIILQLQPHIAALDRPAQVDLDAVKTIQVVPYPGGWIRIRFIFQEGKIWWDIGEFKGEFTKRCHIPPRYYNLTEPFKNQNEGREIVNRLREWMKKNMAS